MFSLQIENLQEQLRDKEKQMSSLKERVKSLQADTSNTDTALTTLEESLAEKVDTFLQTCISPSVLINKCWLIICIRILLDSFLHLFIGADHRASKRAER